MSNDRGFIDRKQHGGLQPWFANNFCAFRQPGSHLIHRRIERAFGNTPQVKAKRKLKKNGTVAKLGVKKDVKVDTVSSLCVEANLFSIFALSVLVLS